MVKGLLLKMDERPFFLLLLAITLCSAEVLNLYFREELLRLLKIC